MARRSVFVSLPDAVNAGDRAETLRALSRRLVVALEDAAPQYVAPLVKQLADVTRELAEIAPARERTPLDELRERRNRSAVPKRPARGGVAGP